MMTMTVFPPLSLRRACPIPKGHLMLHNMKNAAIGLLVACAACAVIVLAITLPGGATELESDATKLFQ